MREGDPMKLTRRGKIVRAVILIAVALYLTTKVASSLWWTDSGYCWGEYETCYKIEGATK